MEFLFTSAPRISIKLQKQDKQDQSENKLKCINPSTLETLGYAKIMKKDDVDEISKKVYAAQKEWCKTTFKERRKVLRSIQMYVIEHCEEICHLCSMDSGKPALDAMMGEILTTCEKIRCVNVNGEVCFPYSPLFFNFRVLPKI